MLLAAARPCWALALSRPRPGPAALAQPAGPRAPRTARPRGAHREWDGVIVGDTGARGPGGRRGAPRSGSGLPRASPRPPAAPRGGAGIPRGPPRRPPCYLLARTNSRVSGSQHFWGVCVPWVCGVGRIRVSLRSAFLFLTLRALLLRGGCGARSPRSGGQALPAGSGRSACRPRTAGDPRLPRRWAVIDSRPAGT